MKKLIALLLALIMVCSFVACEKDENSSDDDVAESTKSDIQGSAERFGFFMRNDTLAKIDSLGKTEENKRIVELYVSEASYLVSVSVYTWSDPESMYDTCETYYFFNHESSYNHEISLAEDSGKTIVEKNPDALWLKYESTGAADKENRGSRWGNLTYNDVYQWISNSPLFEIVE